MNKYNHWIAKVVRFFNSRWGECAITFGQTSYFTCDESKVDEAWHCHEDQHKKQWYRDGWLKFTVLYLWWSLQYGYENNPYEIEAQKAAQESIDELRRIA